MPRYIIIDPALQNFAGHHFAAAQGLVDLAKESGSAIEVLAHHDVSFADIEAHPVRGVFSGTFYGASPSDRLAAQRELSRQTIRFRDDMQRALPRIEHADTIHLLHATLVTLNGLAAWLSGLPDRMRPAVVIWHMVNPANDEFCLALGTPLNFSAAIQRLSANARELRLIASAHEQASYLAALGCGEASTVPFIALRKPLAKPEGEPGLFIASIGHLGPRKGAHLLLPAIRRLNEQGLRKHWTIAGESFDPARFSLDEVRKATRPEDGIEFVELSSGASDYEDLLRKAKLVLLPYSPEAYANMPSGVAEEAEYLGIPYIAPNVGFSKLAAEAGAAVQFAEWNAEKLADAVATALERLPQLTANAQVFGKQRAKNIDDLRLEARKTLDGSELSAASVAAVEDCSVNDELPRVDVIVTLHNYRQFLAACLASVARQTYPNWRCFVVDDGSTDIAEHELREIVGGFGPRFTFAQHSVAAGQVQAFAMGLSLGASPFVVFLDADDELTDSALDHHLSWHLNRDIPVALTSGTVNVIDLHGRIIAGNYDHFRWLGDLDYLHALPTATRFCRSDPAIAHSTARFADARKAPFGQFNWNPTSALMFRRSMLEMLIPDKFDRSMHSGDTYYGMGAAALGSYILIDAPTARYRRHGSNYSSGRPIYGAGTFRVRSADPDALEIAAVLRRHIEANHETFYNRLPTELVDRLLAVAPPYTHLSSENDLTRSMSPIRDTTVQTENRHFGRLGRTANLLKSGWHNPEIWGVWSNGHRAVVHWPYPRDWAVGKSISFAIRGRVGLSRRHAQAVKVLVNGRYVGSIRRWLWSGTARRAFTVPSKVVALQSPIEITFEIAEPTSPHARGHGPDMRRIGFGLEAISVSGVKP